MARIDEEIEEIEQRESLADTLIIAGSGADKLYFKVSSQVLLESKVFYELLMKAPVPGKEAIGGTSIYFRFYLEYDNPQAIEYVLLFLHARKAELPQSMELLLEISAVIRKYELRDKMGNYLEYIRLKQQSLEAARSYSSWFDTITNARRQNCAASFREMSRLLVLYSDTSFDNLRDDVLPEQPPEYFMDSNPQIAFKATFALEQARSQLRLKILEFLYREANNEFGNVKHTIYDECRYISQPELLYVLGGSDNETQGLSPQCIGNLSVHGILVRVYEMELFVLPGGFDPDGTPHTALSKLVVPVVDKLLSQFRGLCLKCHSNNSATSIDGCNHDSEE